VMRSPGTNWIIMNRSRIAPAMVSKAEAILRPMNLTKFKDAYRLLRN
jgi:hypothetical protein